MLATATDALPTGPEWVHEVKWDGMRVLADVHDGAVVLRSRTGNDITASFPELAGLGQTYADLLLDGEVVVLDDGRPSFAALGERMHVRSAAKARRLAAARPATLMVFDLLRLFGTDLTGQPWTTRRELLERLELSGPAWQVPAVHDDGASLWAATAERGLEGVVSKRRTSTYAAGRRSPDWLKRPHRATLSAVVGGWRPEVGTLDRLGAVLLGLPDGNGGWRYAGRMGSGLAGTAGARMQALLAPLARSTPPFSDAVPPEDGDIARWVEPTVVVEVRTLGDAGQSRLRQPTFLGIRADLTPEEVSG